MSKTKKYDIKAVKELHADMIDKIQTNLDIINNALYRAESPEDLRAVRPSITALLAKVKELRYYVNLDAGNLENRYRI